MTSQSTWTPDQPPACWRRVAQAAAPILKTLRQPEGAIPMTGTVRSRSYAHPMTTEPTASLLALRCESNCTIGPTANLLAVRCASNCTNIFPEETMTGTVRPLKSFGTAGLISAARTCFGPVKSLKTRRAGNLSARSWSYGDFSKGGRFPGTAGFCTHLEAGPTIGGRGE